MDLPAAGGFGGRLRAWRERRGLSQLRLAMNAGISGRHLSFLETGRSRPSRPMVLRLGEALDLPLRERNELLLSAGFAPGYADRGLGEAASAEAERALDFLLRAHEPNPAIILDRLWNLVRWNRPHERLMIPLLPVGESLERLNGLDLVFEAGPFRSCLANWEQVAAAVLRRLRRQVLGAPGDGEIAERWERARAAPGVAELGEIAWERADPLVPMILEAEGQRISLVNTLATFGAPGDASLEELVLETFFPADEATAELLAQLAAAEGGGKAAARGHRP